MPGESVPQGLWLPPRVATLLVAANDALDRSRAQCDFLCDGVADDVQINAALNALPAANGRVVLSEGTFNCTADITIPEAVTLEGQGYNTVLAFTGDAIANALTINGDGVNIKNLIAILADGAGVITARPNVIYNNSYDHILLENLFVYGDESVADDGDNLRQCGILFVAAAYSKIINCYAADNDRHGIHLNNTTNCIVEGNHSSSNGQWGIYLSSGSARNNIVDNNCDLNGYGGIEIAGWAENNQITGNVCNLNLGRGMTIVGDYNSIIGNQCSTNHREGIYSSGARCQINDNHIYDNGQEAAGMYDGIGIGGTATSCQINGNFIDSPGDSQQDGILVGAGAHHIQIIGNYCLNGMGDGIQVANNNYCLIKDNYCLNNDDYGIVIAGVENTVENNKFEGNNGGGVGLQVLDNGTDTILPEVRIPAPNPDSNIGQHAAQQMLDGVLTDVRMELPLPSSFQQLVRAQVILVAAAGGNLYWSSDTDFGKICAAEDYNTHSDTIAANATAVLINDLTCITIDAALDGINASDWVGIKFTRRAEDALDTIDDTVYLLGLRVQYV